jgi:ribonuclease J
MRRTGGATITLRAVTSTQLTFLSVGNPTGVKFAVEYGAARALFDLGLAHAPGRAPFSLGLRPRAGRALDDLLAVGMAPAESGVLGSWDGRTSLFLSHLHLDHTALVPFVHPDVPLHFPEEMEELRAASVAAGYQQWREPVGRGVPDGGQVPVGEMQVEFVAVDHDLPGASGFLVRTPDLTLAYTGDHRWHGMHPATTAAFARRTAGIDVLVLEAVGLAQLAGDRRRPQGQEDGPNGLQAGHRQPAREGVLDEAELAARFEELLAACDGLVVVNLYPMNRERVHAFGAACARQGRQLLLPPSAARLADWNGVLVQAERVRRWPGRHCVQLGFNDLPTLIDLQPPTGSVFVHSNGPPLGEVEPGYAVMRAWADAFDLAFVSLGTGGHSTPEDLARMIRLVRPGLVLPVHSRRPDLLPAGDNPWLVPAPRRPYSSAELKGAARTAGMPVHTGL